ncbi:Alpha/beta hydrolase [Candidatus Hodgkinia cicadicola]|uniref:Alpha/beta hydrolase n=1 Tax=Candidatus Hodgkinia cicadicola TaxID=573658 RepID=A0ABX4MJ93_9HYPH|nr:Alpha/beta hydrolase [Candidatus Hodgkinia cicadicola]
MPLELQIFNIAYQLSYWSVYESPQMIYVIGSDLNVVRDFDLTDNLVSVLKCNDLNVVSQKVNATRINNFTIYKDNLIVAELTMNWILKKHGYNSNIIIIGISFGACIAAELIMRRPEISEYILISPPIGYYNLATLAKLDVIGTMIFSDHDIFAPLSKVYKLHNNAKMNLMCKLKLMLMRNTNYSYKNRFDLLSTVVTKKCIKCIKRFIYENDVGL